MEKLVRDFVPGMIAADGRIPRIRTIGYNDEYWAALRHKIVEEAKEIFEARTPQEEIEEIGDLIDVVELLCRFRGITPEQVVEMRNQKEAACGGFTKRFVLAIDE